MCALMLIFIRLPIWVPHDLSINFVSFKTYSEVIDLVLWKQTYKCPSKIWIKQLFWAYLLSCVIVYPAMSFYENLCWTRVKPFLNLVALVLAVWKNTESDFLICLQTRDFLTTDMVAVVTAASHSAERFLCAKLTAFEFLIWFRVY